MWSQASGIDLSEINRLEREFLIGVDVSLYVSGKKYVPWLYLLKGLVLAKEFESQKWRRSHTRYRDSRRLQHTISTPSMRTTTRSRCHSTMYRAHSTSPLQYIQPHVSTDLAARPHLHVSLPPLPSPNSGLKRSAEDAFTPTPTSFNELPPLKRHTGTALHIPKNRFSVGPSSASSVQPFPAVPEDRPQTLVAAYRVDRPVNVLRVSRFPFVCVKSSSRFPRIFTTIPWLGRLPIQKRNKNRSRERTVYCASNLLRCICRLTSSPLL